MSVSHWPCIDNSVLEHRRQYTKEFERAVVTANVEDIQRMLVDSFCAASVKDRIGNTPLHWAAMSASNSDNLSYHAMGVYNENLTTVLSLLLQRDFNVDAENKHGNTPLMLAIKHSSKARPASLHMIQMLLTAGAVVSHRNKNGCTSLYFAAEANNVKIVKLLVETGVDVTVKDTFSGKSALDVAEENYRNTRGYDQGLENLEAGQIKCILYWFELKQERRAAFAMALHERLGTGSLAYGIDKDVARLIEGCGV